MVDKECNLRAGVYKVQTFGTTQIKNTYGAIAQSKSGLQVLMGFCFLSFIIFIILKDALSAGMERKNRRSYLEHAPTSRENLIYSPMKDASR
jgi:hypothetical protein